MTREGVPAKRSGWICRAGLCTLGKGQTFEGMAIMLVSLHDDVSSEPGLYLTHSEHEYDFREHKKFNSLT